MGMAASQARFLGLTARKTNTEYEGQQVNQQRTTLSNQSANYYNELLGMTVPTPPSVENFTKTTYTFTDGSLNNTINSLIAQVDGSYLVSYTRKWTNDNAVVAASSSIVTRTGSKGNYAYSVGSKVLRDLASINFTDSTGGALYYQLNRGVYSWYDANGEKVENVDEEKVKINSDDEYLKTLTVEQAKNMIKEEKEYEAMLKKKYGDVSDWKVIYKQDTTSGTWVPTFYRGKDLENSLYSETGSSLSFIGAFTTGKTTETDEVKGAKARLEQDASGRYINITLYDADGVPTTYSLNTTSTTDQAAYDDAMNQYEYEKAQYDQSVQNVNAKIEVIQSQDKTLELRLKQLDTEQEAIQTEMEAVQKVIEKNTQDTFKTFA